MELKMKEKEYYNVDTTKYKESYNENDFWDKIAKFAKKAGYELIEKALILYYVATDKETPNHIKGIIFGALGYFILPLDIIPDITPVIGFTDDLGVLIGAMALVSVHIKKEHKIQAKKKLKEWFGD
jgi:uncharacterized membrane protein YkvA (DUF1232 family)